MSKLESIVEELKHLPEPELQEAARYVHELYVAGHGDRKEVLQKTSGMWSSDEGETIERTINEGCERIDPHEW